MEPDKDSCDRCAAVGVRVWYVCGRRLCETCKAVKTQLRSSAQLTLPIEDAARKALPIFDGVVLYFPLAMAAIAHVSKLGNDQHNPGEPLHWTKEKSTDHRNTQMRHMIDAASGNPFDKDGGRHSAKAAWRALALLETEIERDGGKLFADPVTTVTGVDGVAVTSRGCVNHSCGTYRHYFGTKPCIMTAGHTTPHQDSEGDTWINGTVSK